MDFDKLFDLTGKVALVTGASRGIGEAIATLLAARGAHVFLASRKLEGLTAVAEKIRANGHQATPLVCHTGKLEMIEAAIASLEEQAGRLDILVNNAATNPHFGPALTVEEWAWDKTFGVNLKGCFFLTQKAVGLMQKSGGGAIVNVASINGVRPAQMQGIYSITKAGLISMTKLFAKELANDGIRVNALLPGLTETRFASGLTENPAILGMILKQIPLGRVAQPEEMAPLVLYLCAPAGSYTTGACFTVDGGFLA